MTMAQQRKQQRAKKAIREHESTTAVALAFKAALGK